MTLKAKVSFQAAWNLFSLVCAGVLWYLINIQVIEWAQIPELNYIFTIGLWGYICLGAVQLLIYFLLVVAAVNGNLRHVEVLFIVMMLLGASLSIILWATPWVDRWESASFFLSTFLGFAISTFFPNNIIRGVFLLSPYLLLLYATVGLA